MTNQEWKGMYRNSEEVWRNYNRSLPPRKIIKQMPAPDAAALFDGRLTGWDKEWLKRLKICNVKRNSETSSQNKSP